MTPRAAQAAAARPNREHETAPVAVRNYTPEPLVAPRALKVVAPPAPPARRRARAEAVAAQAATLRDAVENLRHTIRFLEELMTSRQVEAERAIARAGADLDDLRQRIVWVRELMRSPHP